MDSSDEQRGAIIPGALPYHRDTPLHQVPVSAQSAVLARVGADRGEIMSAFQSSGSEQPSP
ncbi:hypothetical protein AB0M39_41360 [Streptomyces sp. NPDC051907]|uniref:hypothetical protein n=1 Tax=Streptomyces sp. NPDC051907 TaxID=3155284 RepID=UPI0034347FD5